MCTVSAFSVNGALTLTMNRDERRQRFEGDLTVTPEYCFPSDLESGGTWCGVNHSRLVFCLLNRYDAPSLQHECKLSRGGIIPAALEAGNIDDANKRVALLNFAHYDGFRLLVLNSQCGYQHDWDGSTYTVTLITNPANIFFSSSSVDSINIPERRERRYRQWQRTQAANKSVESNSTIPTVHLREPCVAPRESIFMVREKTHTKSITQINVSNSQASLVYWPAQTGFDRHQFQQWNGG